MNPARERMIRYLEDHFIQGRRVEASTIAANHYRYIGEEFFRPWPDGFDYIWFCRLREAAEYEDLRLAGLKPSMVR